MGVWRGIEGMPNQRASSSKEHQDLIVVSPSLDLTEAFPLSSRASRPASVIRTLATAISFLLAPLPARAASDAYRRMPPVLAA